MNDNWLAIFVFPFVHSLHDVDVGHLLETRTPKLNYLALICWPLALVISGICHSLFRENPTT
jgi:hypothetical protein